LFAVSPDGTNWDASERAVAESQPDGIVRVFTDHGEVLLFGGDTIEPWGNIGALDFPFLAVKGSIIEMGLAARWTVTKINDGVAFLGKNTNGQAQVYYIRGYTPTKISTVQLDALIESYGGISSASGLGFMDRGHPMYQINFAGAQEGLGISWRYDFTTGLWSEVAYGENESRHRAELQIDFLNRTLVSDYDNGNIYILDAETYTDNGEFIPREIQSRHVFNGGEKLVVNELYVDFEPGVGLQNGQGSDPQVMLQISKDNGNTWGNELWTTLGTIGQYLTRVHWRRLGISYDWVFRLRITDPVKVVMTFAALRLRKVA
jgi:hypothetical protein